MGVAWAVLQPLLMMVIFTLFLGRLAKVPSDGLPYPVFAFVGTGAVDLFANAVDQRHREPHRQRERGVQGLLPAPARALRRAARRGSPDLAIASRALVVLMLIYGFVPAATHRPAPGRSRCSRSSPPRAWACGSSALNVSYRDVRYVVPFLIQLWLFATPVVYPATSSRSSGGRCRPEPDGRGRRRLPLGAVRDGRSDVGADGRLGRRRRSRCSWAGCSASAGSSTGSPMSSESAPSASRASASATSSARPRAARSSYRSLREDLVGAFRRDRQRRRADDISGR